MSARRWSPSDRAEPLSYQQGPSSFSEMSLVFRASPLLAGPSGLQVLPRLSAWPSVLLNRSSSRIEAARTRPPPALLRPSGPVLEGPRLVSLLVPVPHRCLAAPAEASALPPISPTSPSGGRGGAAHPPTVYHTGDTRGRRRGQDLF